MKKQQIKIKCSFESLSNRIENVENRISELEKKWLILNIQTVIKKISNHKQNIQKKPWDIRRPNLRITGIKEGCEVQANGIDNLFREIIPEKFPNFEKNSP